MTNVKRNVLLGVAVIGAILLAVGTNSFADTYTYDALGRLTGVTYADGSSITYAYDDAGNRTTVTQTP